MQIFQDQNVFYLEKEGVRIGSCTVERRAGGVCISRFCIAPAWRRRGYGTYLLRQVLRRTGGFDRGAASLHTVPWPDDEGELAFWRRLGFTAEALPGGAGCPGPEPAGLPLSNGQGVPGPAALCPGGGPRCTAAFGQGKDAPADMPRGSPAASAFARQAAGTAAGGPSRLLVRRRQPDLSAVKLAHEFLAARLPAPRLCIDATCGNGGDTEFLCRLCAAGGAANWQVLAMDLQPRAVENTAARLEKAGFAPPRLRVVCDSHANLLRYAAPNSADAVLFNFGWLPGADHSLFSTAGSSLPALEAALTALRPGGVLSAVLYSGKTIGSSEKQAVLAWLRALPPERYTVLVCEFANWADTAPLPCMVLKK